MTNLRGRVLELVQTIATELVQAGARAVVLMGSHARGVATAESDIDLYALGGGPEYWLERRDGLLVSISWRTLEELEASFASPADVGGHVPGWRQAVVLADPDGLAARLVERANAWTWNDIGDDRLNAWVAGKLTGYAEEVHKLVEHMSRRSLQFASVERSVLALRVPMIMAVHQRILYGSENELWDIVAGHMGREWTRNQSAALGLTGQPFHDSCDGALGLYVMACEAAAGLFDKRQRAVIGHACNLARQASDDVNLN